MMMPHYLSLEQVYKLVVELKENTGHPEDWMHFVVCAHKVKVQVDIHKLISPFGTDRCFIYAIILTIKGIVNEGKTYMSSTRK